MGARTFCFSSLCLLFESENHSRILESGKTMQSCGQSYNRETAFDKEQELHIGVQAMKEFAMKIKMYPHEKGKFAYFNGIVNHLMDKYYFDPEFSMA